VSENEKGLGAQPEALLNENYPSPDNQNSESTQGAINWQDDPRIILVIEQRDTLGSEAIIFIAPESLRLFAQAINGLAGDTGAERARRYREKKKSVTVRDAARDANVTELRLVKGST
jgi:hypothetical protein